MKKLSALLLVVMLVMVTPTSAFAETITETVDLTGTVTWVAAARQDVDAQVEMEVFQLDPDDSSKSSIVATKMLTGFGTESPSKTATFTGLPKYNANGHEYLYTVMEGSVKTQVGNRFESSKTSIIGGVTYLITFDGYRYRNEITKVPSKTTVRNVLVGDAQVVINKTFTSGLPANPTTLTYTIYQNGTAIGTKTVTYQDQTAVPFTPDPITITSYEDMDAGSYTGSGLLPRYDENGAQYRYTTFTKTQITTAGGYDSTNVTGTYVASPTGDTVYSVDVVWGSMAFTYTGASTGTWNPATHTYYDATEAGWSCVDGANKVTVTNHSNTAVTSAFTYSQGEGYNSVTGAFNNSSLTIPTAVGTEFANAPSASAMLSLTGALASTVTTATTIGSVTVTIS